MTICVEIEKKNRKGVKKDLKKHACYYAQHLHLPTETTRQLNQRADVLKPLFTSELAS